MNHDDHQPEKTTSVTSPDPDFILLLKRIVLYQNPAAAAVEDTDLMRTLACHDLTPEQRKVLPVPLPEPMSVEEFTALSGLRKTGGRSLMLSQAQQALLYRIFNLGPVPLLTAFGDMQRQSQMMGRFQRLKTALDGVPGQDKNSALLAADIAQQLARKNPTEAACVLLHGEKAWGTQVMAETIANELAQQDPQRKHIVIDCSTFRSAGEAASLTGSKAYWSGSGPGLITQFLYENPKGIVILVGLDETQAAVLAALRGAFSSGVLVDDYGLEDPPEEQRASGNRERKPTPVDCRNALFLATVSYAADALTLPDRDAVLGKDPARQRARLLAELGRANFTHRGETVQRLDSEVLQAFSRHHYLLDPVQWPDLVQMAAKSMNQAIELVRADWYQDVVVSAAGKRALASLLLLAHGPDAGLQSVTAQTVLRELLLPLFTLVVESAVPTGKIRLQVPIAAVNRVLDELGEDPLRTLRRRQRALAWKLVSRKGNRVAITGIRLEPLPRLADYSGAGALASGIPAERLDDVAGHDEVRAYLREVIGLLHQPDRLVTAGLALPRGVILEGPPGTGKTLITRAFAGEAGLPIIAVTGFELLDPAVQNRVYHLAARIQPVVILVNEADALGRRGTRSTAHDAAINNLLEHIDGYHGNGTIFHVLTTNHVDQLDPALMRSGRIDMRFHIGALDREGRKALLTPMWPLLESAVDQEDIIAATDGLVGADLVRLRRDLMLRLQQENRELAPESWLHELIDDLYFGSTQLRQPGPEDMRRVACNLAGKVLAMRCLQPEVVIQRVCLGKRNNGAAAIRMQRDGGTRNIARTITDIQTDIAVLLAGKIAEELVFGTPSLEAMQHVREATELAISTVANMNLPAIGKDISPIALSKAGLVLYKDRDAINQVARSLLTNASMRVRELLQQRKSQLCTLSAVLISSRSLGSQQIAALCPDQPPVVKNDDLNQGEMP